MTVETIRLEKLCSIRSGGTPRRSNTEYYGGNILWAKIQDLGSPDGVIHSTTETLTEAGLESIGGRLFPKGTILLAMYGSVGKVAVAGQEMSTNQAILGIQVEDVERLSSDYLICWLHRIQPELVRSARGVTQKNISATIVRNLQIPLPPLPEQRRIATILDKADAIRRKRQQTLDLADQFLRSAFLDMFGDPVTNPKGWPRVTIKDCAAEIADCPHSTPKWTDEGVVCIRTSNLGRGTWQWDDTRFVSEEEYVERSSRGEAMPGDIVLSREGTVGIAAIVPRDKRLCMGQRLVRVRPGPELQSEYLLAVLLRLLFPDVIARVMVGSTSKHLNVGEFRRMKIPLPPMGLQERYSSIVSLARNLRDGLSRSAEKESCLRSSLLQRAFRGVL